MIAGQFMLCHANLSHLLFAMKLLLKNQLTTLRDSVIDVMYLKGFSHVILGYIGHTQNYLTMVGNLKITV